MPRPDTSPSKSYAAWLGLLVRDPGAALVSETIDAYWTVNHEHPPLNKIWNAGVPLISVYKNGPA
jgi:hypothetical protein